MKGGVTTNLLGRRVQITLGLNDEELSREIESQQRNPNGIRRGDARYYLAQFGEVSAVFSDSGILQFTLAVDGGNFASRPGGAFRRA